MEGARTAHGGTSANCSFLLFPALDVGSQCRSVFQTCLEVIVKATLSLCDYLAFSIWLALSSDIGSAWCQDPVVYTWDM